MEGFLMTDASAHGDDHACSVSAHVVHGNRVDDVIAVAVEGPDTDLQSISGDFSIAYAANLN